MPQRTYTIASTLLAIAVLNCNVYCQRLNMSESVRDGLASHFGIWDHADVCIRFHLERSPEQQQEERQDEAEGARACGSARQFVDDPLPAHTIILVLATPFLKTRLEKACWKRMAAGVRTQDGVAASDAVDGHRDKRQRLEVVSAGAASGSEGGRDRGAVSALPEVLVPLSSEAEVPFARQAIEYIYTGSLSADLGFEALLRVRQQACYLGVKHCPQACDRAMLAWLQAGAEQGQQQQQDGAGPSTGNEAVPAVLQAYACHALFPESGTDGEPASFEPVRSTLAKQLLSHFADAVSALTRRDLYRQLLQLPAVAVRELLASDDFGTDSEDSVFLLLACWLEANKGEEAATRAELCGLVRLHRLSSTYLHDVLPVYDPFTISRADLGFLLRCAGVDTKDKEDLFACAPQRRLSPWFCSPARRQVVPAEGRTVEWSISRDQLEQGLRRMMESKKMVPVVASFGASAFGPALSFSCGLIWRVSLMLDPTKMDPQGDGDAPGPGAAGISVSCHARRHLGVVSGLTATEALVVVRGSRTAVWSGRCQRSRNRLLGRMGGWITALALEPAGPAAAGTAVAAGPGGGAAAAPAVAAAGAAGGGNGGEAGEQQPQVQEEQRLQQAQEQQEWYQREARVAAQLARFSEWMQDGKITGSITFYRP